VQWLIYIFVVLAAAGLATAAYFGLTFSPIEAIVTAISVASLTIMMMERRLRRKADARLEKAIDDLGRLLSTDAKAGQVLSQRVNALIDTNVGSRLESIEADISVLGTVVRQVAESVADMQEHPPGAMQRSGIALSERNQPVAAPPPDEDMLPEPLIPMQQVLAALESQRLVFHAEPMVQLPQRRPVLYDLVPRLLLEDGTLADAPDFLPRQGGDEAVRRVQLMALDEAVTVSRRARTAGQPIRLGLWISRTSLIDKRTLDQMLATLSANEAIAPGIVYGIAYDEWRSFGAPEKRLAIELRKTGVSLALLASSSLRLDFGELEGLGFTGVRFDASHFLRQPTNFTDFHTADISPYARRFSIDLCATGVIDEQQVLSLFEDGITLAQGPHIGRAGPLRPDLVSARSQTSPARVGAR
jgi:cyclic-di-GMP phosphodiesterase TipF (flagellum assembly factor)